MRRLTYLKGVTTLQLDQERCVGCGMCLVVCPHAVLKADGERGRVQIADVDACMECGACAQNCPVDAVTVSAGVGCAAAVINSMLGRESSSCCCVIEPGKGEAGSATSSRKGSKETGCC